MSETAGTGYRAFFRTRHVPSLVASMTIARLPVGVITIVLVLFVSGRYGAAVAGFSTAAFTAGMACFAPVFGRLVDKGFGPSTLRILAIVEMASVVALVAAVLCGAPAFAAVAAAFACGAFMPPIAGVTRSLWPAMLDMGLVATAYNFEVLIIDVLYVTGPLLASVFVAMGRPELGMLATTAASGVGAFALAALEPVKSHARRNRERRRGAGVQAGGRLDGSGHPPARAASPAPGAEAGAAVTGGAPLLTAPIALLLLVCLSKFSFSGWMETLIPLYYSDAGSAALGSVAISAWSVGAVAGVVLFHRFQPQPRTLAPIRQLAVFAAAFFAITMLSPLGMGSFALMCAVMFAIGAGGAPGDNLYYQLAGSLAPQERQAEMFSWLNTATSIGLAIGAFFAGCTADALGYGPAFALPCLCSAISVAFAAALIRAAGRSRSPRRGRDGAAQAVGADVA